MSRLPGDIEEELTRAMGVVKAVTPVSGGCINNGARVETSQGHFFVKWNDRSAYPGMFKAEARGLALLTKAAAIRIPQVIKVLEGKSHDGLLLEYISTRRTTALAGERMGRQLAALHQVHDEEYGLDHDNWMGSLRQYNRKSRDPIEFLITQRLQPQAEIALDQGAFSKSFSSKLEKLYQRLPELLVNEPPSLIHGDLWSGNYMVTEEEQPVLIDPAVAYGHREMDMAMTTLFGGFPESFYDAYQEVFPLASGFRARFEIYNLYPLLVHVNLFGGGYASQVQHIVNRFC